MTTPSPAVAVRLVDVGDPVSAIDDVAGYNRVRVYARRGGRLLGFVEIPSRGSSISARQVREALVDAFGVRLIAPDDGQSIATMQETLIASLSRHLVTPEQERTDTPGEALDDDVSISIVLPTLDRPDELRLCLTGLREQQTRRDVEIVVVDNRPASGRIRPVVSDFPDVVLVEEARQGLAYARNAGILASSGDVIVTTDDDVRHPPDWLEKLVAPLARNDVGAVTGNILPLELETRAQRAFEVYGGLGRGFERKEVGLRWLHQSLWGAPTWRLGATANAAFRASVFEASEVGLLPEALGPGMPSGVGEDTYLFYKILKAGYTIIYEADAYVWHRHRSDMALLRKQIYDYSKGHVAYHLTTLLNDGDLRALGYLLLRLPYGHARRMISEAAGRRAYPLGLHLVEIGGNLAGPVSLWRSRRRVAREGRSGRQAPHTPEVSS